MQHPKITSDVDIGQRAILRRYMNLPKLLDLVHSRKLYLRRADGFGDRLEGALFPMFRASMEARFASGESTYSADDYYRKARQGHYVSSWTLGARDNMALWQLYGGAIDSVAITTTVERLVGAAFPWRRAVRIYRVKYVDHLKVKSYILGQYSDVLQYKHNAFSFEKEIRLVVPQLDGDIDTNPLGIRLPIGDLSKFLRSIVVAPEASDEFLEAVRELCSRFNVTSPVRRSKLAFVPT